MIASPAWLAALSLAVATAGGIPGVLSTITFYRKRPRLKVVLVSVISGTMVTEPPPETRTMVAFSLTLGNEGETPIVPAQFNCELFLKGVWTLLRPEYIPAKLRFTSDEQTIYVDDPHSQDLQRQRLSLLQHAPVTGMLMYTSDAFTQDEFRQIGPSKMRLTCLDLLGRKHVAVVPLEPTSIDSGRAYPKHGVRVTIGPSNSGATAV